MSPPPSKELAKVALEAAQAGAAELVAWRGRFETREKGPSDLVTDADLAAQRAIHAVIAGAYPDHDFVGEESDAHHRPPAESVCWVVDPLDGTTNYVHGFPCYGPSVAVLQGNRVLAAAIVDPSRGEAFWAAEGQGAWLGDQRLSTTSAASLSEALVAMSLPAAVSSRSPDLLDFVSVAPYCRAVRRIGSAALNLAYVACGRLDAYWARQINAWDVAAGVLLVTEAGGVVTSPHGKPFDIWRAELVASAGADLHQAMLDRLEQSATAGSAVEG